MKKTCIGASLGAFTVTQEDTLSFCASVSDSIVGKNTNSHISGEKRMGGKGFMDPEDLEA